VLENYLWLITACWWVF